MKAHRYIVYFLLLVSINGFSQKNQSQFMIWRLTSLSGEARLRGTYREYQTNSEINALAVRKDSYLTGLLQLRTKSFFVHPNFMLVNLDLSYNPETRRDYNVGLPSYSEITNREGIDFSALFFGKQPINLTTNIRLNNTLQNIDNIATVRTLTKEYGATLSFKNKFLPMSVGVAEQKSEQTSKESPQKYNFDQRLVQATITKSFTDFDNHSLDYVHTENKSTFTNPNIPIPAPTLVNVIDLFELNNAISFDSAQNYRFTSNISNSTERGVIYFNRFYARESLVLELPRNLTLMNGLNLGRTDMAVDEINFRGFQSSLAHQLYASLNTKIFFEQNKTSQRNLEETRNKIGFDILYNKNIPAGKLKLNYTYYREFQEVKTPSNILNIVHEQYTLVDNQITLFTNQNVYIPSVVVKDITGTIIYRLNVDYFLVAHDPYLEIVRIPGGMIPNNSSVYITYSAIRAGQYNFYMNFHSFGIDLLYFKDILNLYYRVYSQDYNNQSETEYLAFNYYARHISGVRLDFNYIRFGVEYEYYNSSILPYQGLKYYFNLNKMYKNVFLTLNGNLWQFQIADEYNRRDDIDLSCKIAYNVLKNLKVDFDFMYKSMKGRGIDVNITTSKLEVTSMIKRLYISLGTEAYWNRDINSRINFRGVFIQLTRNF